MRKLLSLLFVSVFFISACSTDEGKNREESNTLTVGSVIPPMTDILEIVKPLMEEEGITLQVEIFNDNVVPNTALANKEIDANFFQHVPYMKEFNEANGSDLVAIQPIYHAIFGAYSKTYKSMEDLPEGATIAIGKDPSNMGRSLTMLHNNGVITLKEGTGTYATVQDIIKNEKNYEFVEVDILMLARMMEDVDLVVMTPAYAAPLGLTPKKDALLTEGIESEFAITLIAREDNKDSEALKILAKKMTGPEVKRFLEEEYADISIPAFE